MRGRRTLRQPHTVWLPKRGIEEKILATASPFHRNQCPSMERSSVSLHQGSKELLPLFIHRHQTRTLKMPLASGVYPPADLAANLRYPPTSSALIAILSCSSYLTFPLHP